MPTTRSFSDANGVQDFTPAINLVPNQWGLVQQLGLFQESGISQTTFGFDVITRDGALITDIARGAIPQVGKDDSRKTHSLTMPRYAAMDAIYPQDIQGKRMYGSADESETLAAVRMRKMERIRQNFAWTLEKARIQVLSDGSVFAPNGTVSINYYTEFSVTQKVVDMVFGTAASDILGKTEEGIASILDNLSGDNASGFVALCSPKFFSGLIKHNTTKVAYQYYTSTGQQQPLRERLGGNTTMYRSFEYGGVTWLEYRAAYAGTQLITDGDAILLPVGTNAFATMYGPCARFDFVNSEGAPLYLFETQTPTEYKLEAETNFINVLEKPAQVVKFTSSTW